MDTRPTTLEWPPIGDRLTMDGMGDAELVATADIPGTRALKGDSLSLRKGEALLFAHPEADEVNDILRHPDKLRYRHRSRYSEARPEEYTVPMTYDAVLDVIRPLRVMLQPFCMSGWHQGTNFVKEDTSGLTEQGKRLLGDVAALASEASWSIRALVDGGAETDDGVDLDALRDTFDRVAEMLGALHHRVTRPDLLWKPDVRTVNALDEVWAEVGRVYRGLQATHPHRDRWTD